MGCVAKGVLLWVFMWLAFAWLIFMAVGIAIVVWVVPQEIREVNRIKSIPSEINYAAIPAGTDVAIEGDLQDNAILTSYYSLFAIADYNLVAYEIDTWIINSGKNGKTSGNWREIGQFVPALTIMLDDQLITTIPVTDPIDVRGNLPEYIDTSLSIEDTTFAEYKGQRLPFSASRLRGFHNGDHVTLVGQKTATGQLALQHLFLGTRPELIDALESDARLEFLVGIAVIIGLLILAALALRYGYRKLRATIA